jgi:DNA-binding response OmpR family regulator
MNWVSDFSTNNNDMKESVNNPIAVVEDDEHVLDAISIVLEAHSHDVLSYKNGEEFLNALDEIQPRVLLLDPHLPGINGAEVLRKMFSSAAVDKLNIVVITAHPNSDEVKKIRGMGVKQILLKPITEEVLLNAIN